MKNRPWKDVAAEVKQWAWPELYERILKLIADEGEFVGRHACFIWPRTPFEFIQRYGLHEPEEYETYECLKYVDPNKHPIHTIQLILVKHWSWGEFIGGVIGAMSKWTSQEKLNVLPFLNTAVQHALEHGVDH